MARTKTATKRPVAPPTPPRIPEPAAASPRARRTPAKAPAPAPSRAVATVVAKAPKAKPPKAAVAKGRSAATPAKPALKGRTPGPVVAPAPAPSRRTGRSKPVPSKTSVGAASDSKRVGGDAATAKGRAKRVEPVTFVSAKPSVAKRAAKRVPEGRTKAPVVKPAPVAKAARPTKPPVRRKTAPAKSASKRPAAPATKRGKKGGRRIPTRPAVPVVRVVKVRELDPIAKCGPSTSVEQLFRVDESAGPHATVHLVFYDRHGWYCVHGPRCVAVSDVHSHNRTMQRARAARR